MYQKGAYKDRGKIFNKLPKCITGLALRKTKNNVKFEEVFNP
jgi:hypothetical protein